MPQEGYKVVTITDTAYELAKRQADEEGLSVGQFVGRAIDNHSSRKRDLEETAKIVLRMIDERNWRSRLESNSAPVVATKMEKENFSVSRLLEGVPEPTKALYYDLEKKIASLGHDVRVEPRKWFVYLAAKKNFGVIKIQKSKLVVYLMLYGASLDDHEKRARPYHWNNSDYQVNVRPGDDLDYIAKLANQGYTNSSRTPGKLWS